MRETVLTPADLIWPLFVTEGQGAEEPIATLPGVSRWSVDRLAERAREARGLGIPCVALFPHTPPGLRDDDASEALNPDNLICRAVKAVKDAAPDLGVLTDVALDPYTAHGHDGLTDEAGCVLNDVYREAEALGVQLSGVRVAAAGGFDTATWASTGITYRVELDSAASESDVERLLARVDEVAEIPRALRAGAPVHRA